MMTSSRLFSEIISLPKTLPLRGFLGAGLRPPLPTIVGGAPMITAGLDTTTGERGRPGSGLADLPLALRRAVRAGVGTGESTGPDPVRPFGRSVGIRRPVRWVGLCRFME